MKQIKILCVWIIMSSVLSTAFAASPVGLWTTIDDKTGKKRAVVSVFEKDGKLYGTIKKIFKQAGDSGKCLKCATFRGVDVKNKPVTGLTFLAGLSNEGNNQWSGGEILDPKSGKIYRAKLTLKGDKLLVRGYIGLSFLGRTQVWQRYA